MFYQLLEKAEPGTRLLPVIHMVSQDKMDQFSEATGNGGTIHMDTRYCEEHYPHKKTFVHGQFLLAFLSEMMELNFGEAWLWSGVMDIKFIGPAHPGETFVATGTITSISPAPEGREVACEVAVANQSGGKAAVGIVRLFLKVSA